MLLEFALASKTSYVWAVTRRSIDTYELPDRAEIERAARRAYELLTVSHRREQRRPSELALADLSRILLAPLAAHLSAKRLLIVGDGALHYVPFAALSAPAAAGREPAPLIVEHEVVSVPSASVLAVQRRELAGRQRAPKLVAVLADPVLQESDSRVSLRRKPTDIVALDLEHREQADRAVRSGSEAGIASFERLPYTRAEAETIAALIPQGQGLTALDFEASRETMTSARLSDYQIIHFATHGVLNSQHPELSGVVLSLVDRRGEPLDGFVRAHEIFNLKLRSELVVISACRTALGKEVKGEGLVGLVRGFMYAGAARVVASVWDVRDEATAALMKRFYEGMLKDGLRPAAALRAAQVSLLRDRRWSAPYFWAGFVLQGEWN